MTRIFNRRALTAAFLFLVGAPFSNPARAAGEFKSHGFILPGGAVRIDDDRYRLPMGWDDVQRFYRNTYPAAKFTRKTLRNQSGVRALHIVNPSGNGWLGINMYEAARGEVRIYVLSNGGADDPDAK
jgi:hypothetical protein